MVEKSDETFSDPMLCLSASMIITADMLSRNRVLPRAMSSVYGDYRYNNNDNIHLSETKVYWLCVINTRKGSRQKWSSLGCSGAFSLSLSLSCFASSGSNLVVLIIKASASCRCRVNQEVKRAPKNSIFTQVDQHNKEHAADRDRLLSCRIKWHRGWLLEADNKQPRW